MDERRAFVILARRFWIEDAKIYARRGKSRAGMIYDGVIPIVKLSGRFGRDEIQALAWWIENKRQS